MIKQISKYLTLLAVTSLFIRIGLWKPYTLQPYEIFIILSFTLLTIFAFRNKDKKFTILIKKMLPIFIAMNALFIVGTYIGWRSFEIDTESWVATIKQFFFFYTVFLGLFCTTYFSEDKNFRLQALVGMSLPILFIFFVPFLNAAQHFTILGNGFALIGFSGNPSILAFYLLIPLAFITNEMLREQNISRKVLYIFGIIFCFALLLWTGSRGAWFSSAIIIVSLVLSYTHNAFNILKYGLIIVLCAISSFFILPHPVKVMSLDRVFPQVTQNNPTLENLKTTSITVTAITNNNTRVTPSGEVPPVTAVSILPYQEREILWPQAVKTIMSHPFGLGVEYSRISKAIIVPDGRWLAAHNTYLQTLLIGGIPLFVLFIYLLYFVTKETRYINDKRTRGLLLSLWIGFLLLISFNDNLITIPWVWIIAGIITGASSRTFKEKSMSATDPIDSTHP